MNTYLGVAAGQPAPQTSAVAHFEAAAYVDLGDSLTGISFLGASAWCFEGWFQFHGLCPDTTLFEKADEFTLGTSGRSVYAQRAGQATALLTPPVLVSDEWTHIAVSFDGATLSLYVNGLPQSSTSSVGAGIEDQGEDFELGAGFQGYIDSFRVWSTNRSASQIYQGQWVSCAGTSGLVAEYDFTVVPPADNSGNANPITFAAGAASMALTPAVDVVGYGYCEPVQEETLVNPGGAGNDAYSIVAWVNFRTTSGQQAIFTNGDLSTASGIYLYVDGGTVYARRGGTSASSLASTTAVTAGQWVCVAYTYDGTNETLYINGTSVGTAAGSAITAMSDSQLFLGVAYSSQSEFMLMNMQGYLQFISVWSIALTADEVTTAMTEDPTDQPGCVANYSFAADSASDLQTGNPIALAQGAKLTVLSAMATGSGAVAFSRRVARQRAADRSAVTLTEEEKEVRAAFYTPERIDAFIDELERAMPHTWTRRRRAAEAAELRDKLERVAAGEAVPGSVRRVRYETRVENGERTITRISPDGEEVMYRGAVSELSACAAAEITVVIDAVDCFLGILGLRFQTSAAQRFFAIRIGEGGFRTAMHAILSQRRTPSSVLKIVALLWDYGWFTSLVVLALNGLTWWDWATLTFRVLSMIVPYPTMQKAFALVQIGLGMSELLAAEKAVDKACRKKKKQAGAFATA